MENTIQKICVVRIKKPLLQMYAGNDLNGS
jgi:hypothetical protein